MQVATFGSYSIDDQYEIYLYGMQRIDPPKLFLATVFGSEGKKVVNYLSAQLQSATKDETTSDVTYVFAEMQRQHAYDVRDDIALMQLLRKAAAKIRDPFWRKINARHLGLIEGQKLNMLRTSSKQASHV